MIIPGNGVPVTFDGPGHVIHASILPVARLFLPQTLPNLRPAFTENTSAKPHTHTRDAEMVGLYATYCMGYEREGDMPLSMVAELLMLHAAFLTSSLLVIAKFTPITAQEL